MEAASARMVELKLMWKAAMASQSEEWSVYDSEDSDSQLEA